MARVAGADDDIPQYREIMKSIEDHFHTVYWQGDRYRSEKHQGETDDRANGMAVFDVDEEEIGALGPVVVAFEFVSHCYRRPRHLPLWPYNLFAMVHARTRPAVETKVKQIRARLGTACRGSTVLYSRRILKKTGLRLAR